ncbi:MAG: radical SAM protein, partial [Methanobacteriaceae archaeon]|nr:radical SAM protein [Methanobacteriaceae archaeon]
SQIGLLIKTRPDALDWEVVSLLKELGAVGVFLGVENASPSGLRALGRGSKQDKINEALELLKGNLSVTFNLLIFHPRATLQEINENIYFMKDHLDLAFDFGRAEIVAGSPLEKMVQRKNLLRGQWPHWDYRIVDDAMEKMFRINALTFYKEDSPYPALSHMLIALSYRSQLLNRFYPGKKSQKFQRETENLILTSNEFTLKNLLEIYHMVAYGEDEIDLLYHQMEAFYAFLTNKASDLSGRMARFQLVEKKFKKRGVDNYLQNSKTMERIFRI